MEVKQCAIKNCDKQNASRLPQFIQCALCDSKIHRECFPNRGNQIKTMCYVILNVMLNFACDKVITKQEYVRMKKDGESFNFICEECVPASNGPSTSNGKNRVDDVT